MTIRFTFIYLALCAYFFSVSNSIAYDSPFNPNSVFQSYSPVLAVSETTQDGTVYHLAYFRGFGGQLIDYRRSTDNGDTWSSPATVSKTASGNVGGGNAEVSIATFEDLVVVVWQNGGDIPNANLYIARSTDGGQNFEDAYILDTSGLRFPKIAFDFEGDIHLVWRDNDAVSVINYATSSNAASSSDWSAPEQIMGNFHHRPVIAIDQNNIYVTAHDTGAASEVINIVSKPITGGAWSSPSSTATLSGNENWAFFDMVANSNGIYLIYTDNVTNDSRNFGNNPVKFIASSDQGSTWSNPVNLGTGYNPALALTTTNELHALWFQPASQGDVNGNVRFRRSPIPGTNLSSWQGAINLNGSEPSRFVWDNITLFARLLGTPDILAHSNQIIAAWTSGTNSTSPTESVRLAKEAINSVATNLDPLSTFFVPADGTSEISLGVTVRGGGNPVVGDTVDFTIINGDGTFADNGTQTTAATTNAQGVASVTYVAGTDNTFVEVAVSDTTNGANVQGTISILQGPADTLTVSASATDIPADESTETTITAVLLLGSTPIPDAEIDVSLNLLSGDTGKLGDGSSTTQTLTTDNQGSVSIDYTAGKEIGDVTIDVSNPTNRQSGNELQETISIFQGQGDSIRVTSQSHQFLQEDEALPSEITIEVEVTSGGTPISSGDVAFQVVTGSGTFNGVNNQDSLTVAIDTNTKKAAVIFNPIGENAELFEILVTHTDHGANITKRVSILRANFDTTSNFSAFTIGSSSPAYAPVMTTSLSGGRTIYHLAYFSTFGLTENQHIYYMRNEQLGSEGSWSSPVKISTALGGKNHFDVSIAAQGDFVYIVWERLDPQNTSVGNTIHLSRSKNAGVSFDDPIVLSVGSASFRRRPDITVDVNGNVHIVWNEKPKGNRSFINLRYRRSIDNGLTWSNPKTLGGNLTLRPSIATDDSNAYIIAHDINANTNRIVLFRNSLATLINSPTANWTTRTVQSTDSSDPYSYPKIASFITESGTERLVTVYEDGTSNNPTITTQNTIYVTFSDNGGASWSAKNPIGTGYMADISIDASDTLRIVWYQGLQDPSNISDAEIQAFKDALTSEELADFEGLSVSDQQSTVAFTFGGSVLVAESSDSGEVWSTEETLNFISVKGINALDYGEAERLLGVPSILSDGEQTTVAWVDNTPNADQVVLAQLNGLIPADKVFFSGLIDDFTPAAQYNASNRNDIVRLPDQPFGGFSDDDGTMNQPSGGNLNDRVLTDGILSLTWDNDDNPIPLDDNGKELTKEPDFWFTVLGDNGVDISDNQFLVLRMSVPSGSKEITTRLRTPEKFSFDQLIPMSALQTEMTTVNLPLSGFVAPSLSGIQSITLLFGEGMETALGRAEIDQILLSETLMPNTVILEITAGVTVDNDTVTDVYDSGTIFTVEISVFDEDGNAIPNFNNSIEFQVSSGIVRKSDGTDAIISGFNANGVATEVFQVISSQPFNLEALEPLTNVLSNSIAFENVNPPVEVVSQFDVTIGEDPNSPIDPFSGAVFPIIIEPKDSNGNPAPLGSGNFSNNQFWNTLGEFRAQFPDLGTIKLLSSGDPELPLSPLPEPDLSGKTILYVAKSGNDDTNDGSQNAPFLTIQHAIDISGAGSVVKVASGTYAELLFIDRDVSAFGGYDASDWSRDVIVNRTIIDARLVDVDDILANGTDDEKGRISPIAHRSSLVTRDTFFDGFILFAPTIAAGTSVPGENGGSAAQLNSFASPTYRNLNLHGPVKDDKIPTTFMSSRSAPLFQNCNLFGGTGNGNSSKQEIILPFRSFPEFEDCAIFPGKNAEGSHRALVEGGNSHSKFTRVVFHPADVLDNDGVSQFIVADYLNNKNFTENYSEFKDCVLFGANAGRKLSDILLLRKSNDTVDFSKYVLNGNHFILGTDTGISPNRFSNIIDEDSDGSNIDDLEEKIGKAGGVAVVVKITSNNGNFVLLDNGVEVTEIDLSKKINGTNSTQALIHGFIRGDITPDASLQLTVESISSGVSGENPANESILKNGDSSEGELEFMKNQQQNTGSDNDPVFGMVQTDLISGPPFIGNTYSNALAVVAFVHQGAVVNRESILFSEDFDSDGDNDPSPALSPFLARAHGILRAFEGAQVPDSDTDNPGGFRDAYDVTNPAPAGETALVTTGNNAWLLIAINYYTLHTGDTQFLDMAGKLANLLASRQQVSGGLFSRETSTATFVTEHQGEAYSAFSVYSQILQHNGDATAAQEFSTRADNVKAFLESVLFIDLDGDGTKDRFRVAQGTDLSPAVDAQTSPFLALQGTDFRPQSAIDFIMTPVNNMLQNQLYLPLEKNIFGPKFRRDSDDQPPNGNVWIEGEGQVALALKVIIDELDELIANTSNQAEQQELEDKRQEAQNNFALLMENIQSVQDTSGGYPTFLGEEIDPFDNNEAVGNANISIVPAVWRYFAEQTPTLNPYFSAPSFIVTPSAIFTKADGTSEIILTVSIRGTLSLVGQNISFSLPAGFTNGSFSGSAVGEQITVQTDANGSATTTYKTGGTPEVIPIKVEYTAANLTELITLLQDIVEDFNHGNNAGGSLVGFGNVLDAEEILPADQGRGGTGDIAFRLKTTGFKPDETITNDNGQEEIVRNDFIGVSKNISVLTLTDGSNASFDVSDKFNTISYWIKNVTDNTTTSVTVAIELVIGDGGDVTPLDSSDNFTGSSWTQGLPVKLKFLNEDNYTVSPAKNNVDDTQNNDFRQIVTQLDKQSFTRTAAPTNNGGTEQTDLVPLLSDITAINIVVNGNGELGIAREILVDDILFFESDTLLTVTQNKLFVPGKKDETVTITATVRDKNGSAVTNPLELRFTTIHSDGTTTVTSQTTNSGIAEHTYTVQEDEPDIVVIRVGNN